MILSIRMGACACCQTIRIARQQRQPTAMTMTMCPDLTDSLPSVGGRWKPTWEAGSADYCAFGRRGRPNREISSLYARARACVCEHNIRIGIPRIPEELIAKAKSLYISDLC